jgi:HTH-type transcriptional regulator/antitoxin HigA
MGKWRDGLYFYSPGEIESDWAIHPGEFLGEEIVARGMTQKALAEALGRPPQAINEIIRGRKAITADTAVGLERVLGTPAYGWLRSQAAYELVRARQRAATAEAPAETRRSPRPPRTQQLRGVAEDAPSFASPPPRKQPRASKPER